MHPHWKRKLRHLQIKKKDWKPFFSLNMEFFVTQHCSKAPLSLRDTLDRLGCRFPTKCLYLAFCHTPATSASDITVPSEVIPFFLHELLIPSRILGGAIALVADCVSTFMGNICHLTFYNSPLYATISITVFPPSPKDKKIKSALVNYYCLSIFVYV